MCDCCPCDPCCCPPQAPQKQSTFERLSVVASPRADFVITSSGEVVPLPSGLQPRSGGSVLIERSSAGRIVGAMGVTPSRPQIKYLPPDEVFPVLSGSHSSLELPNFQTPESVRCENGLEFNGVFRIDHLQNYAWLRPTTLMSNQVFSIGQPNILNSSGNAVQMSYQTGRWLIPPYPPNAGTDAPSLAAHFQDEPPVIINGQNFGNIAGINKVYLQYLAGPAEIAAQSIVFRTAETRVNLIDGSLNPPQPNSSQTTPNALWRNARFWAVTGLGAVYAGGMRATAEWRVGYINPATQIEERPGRPTDNPTSLRVQLIGAWLFMQAPDDGGPNPAAWLLVAPYYASGGSVDAQTGLYQPLYQPGSAAYFSFNVYNPGISEWASYCPVPVPGDFPTQSIGGVSTYQTKLTFGPEFSSLQVPAFTGEPVNSNPTPTVQKTGYRSRRVGLQPYEEQHSAEYIDSSVNLNQSGIGWAVDGESTQFWTLIRMPPLPGPPGVERPEGILKIQGIETTFKVSIRGGTILEFGLNELVTGFNLSETVLSLFGYHGHPDAPMASALLLVGTRLSGYSNTYFLAAWHPWRDATLEEWAALPIVRPRTYSAFVKHLEGGRPTPAGPRHGLAILPSAAYSKLPYTRAQIPFLLPLKLERELGGQWVEDPKSLLALIQIPEGYHTGRWVWPDDRKKTILRGRFRITYAMPLSAYHPNQSQRFDDLVPIIMARGLKKSETMLPVGATWTRTPFLRSYNAFIWPQTESRAWNRGQNVILEFDLHNPLSVSQWAVFLN